MRLAHHVGHLIVDLVRFSVARRQVSLFIVVVVTAAVVLFTVATQAVAPFALYPFI